MKNILYGLLISVFLSSCNGKTHEKSQELEQEKISNPIVDHGADPWVIKQDSLFHYCYAKGNAIYVKSVQRISAFNTAEEYMIWQAPDSGMYSKEIWAPELHWLNNQWFVYFAADDGDNTNHRMYVLSSKEKLPHSPFEFKGKISDDTDKWAIDGTVFTYQNKTYYLWSGWEGDVNEAQHLYIAEMGSPTTIISSRVKISSPEYEWEKRGSNEDLPTINEGPEVIQKDGKLFIVYSASGSWSNDYCLGMLTLTGTDPLQPDSWTKGERAVFSGTEQVISPGHASFIESGGQDYIVYHAMPVKGGGWNSRQVRIQPFSWENGNPNFGEPTGNGVKVDIQF